MINAYIFFHLKSVEIDSLCFIIFSRLSPLTAYKGCLQRKEIIIISMYMLFNMNYSESSQTGL